MGHRWIVDGRDKADFFIKFINDQFQSGEILCYGIKKYGRTERQNNAMHLWFRQMADQLNDAGYSAKHPFNDEIEVPFTEVLVKEMLYKPIIKAMYDKKSTATLTGGQVSEAAEVLVRWLSEKKGIDVPFPQTLKDDI
jgi:hypothetical protein